MIDERSGQRRKPWLREGSWTGLPERARVPRVRRRVPADPQQARALHAAILVLRPAQQLPLQPPYDAWDQDAFVRVPECTVLH